jgi:formylglycine-generating enzyme required for sulfatase activity
MSKRILLVFSFLILCVSPRLWAQDTKYRPEGEQIPGPEKPEDSAAWRADIQHWRRERLLRLGHDGREYSRPELEWTQRSFVLSHMMIEDRYFYDPASGQYAIARFLDDLERNIGGTDSVLIWHTYPNLGIDNRNQFDRLRDMPGGLQTLRQAVAEFHRRGVKVFFPETPWDLGTREEGLPDWTQLARLLTELDADGILGDTMGSEGGVSRIYRVASDQTGHPLALLPEGQMPDEAIGWNNMSWGYWTYSFVPTICRYKWLEPRHMVIITGGGRDRISGLQHAFFNGIGFANQQYVIGAAQPLTPRDAEALRRISKIERVFASLLVSPDWEPHAPTLQYGVFASTFPGKKQTLWTIVNRNAYEVVGSQIEIPHRPGTIYYDIWHGTEIKPELKGDAAILSFDMEPQGFGAILVTADGPLNEDAQRLVAEMRELSRKPLSDYSREEKFLPQRIVEIPSTRPARIPPPGMVQIPAGRFDFRVSGVEIAGGNDVGVDVQYPWESSPRRQHLKTMTVKRFYVDKYPVTNADFKKFLDATGYHPKDAHNFLREWKNGMYPDRWGNKPVTWVSLEDARAYASWAGKRLPHEWEWQYAAQGPDGRLYPWGNEWDHTAVPVPDKRREMREPTDVNAYPKGASPFGVMDLVGNVWQWTDEFVDEHTRAAILRGGSYYQPQGSRWYFPQAYELNQHGKCLLMAPSIDRSGAVGFRCVLDAE